MNHKCRGTTIQVGYPTLQVAKEACSNNGQCGCIYADDCDVDAFLTKRGREVDPSPKGGCSWNKSKFTFPFHTRKIMYFTYYT